ncbi:MAG: SOS response-associated peptidase [Acidimicrobiales bacterium]
MCGRFVASRPVEEIVEQFGIDDVRVPAELGAPRFNIAPQDDVLAIRDVKSDPKDRAGSCPVAARRLSTFRWGLVPSWAEGPSVGARAFNARAETLAERPMFRKALADRRCIIPADAFYEWQQLGSVTKGRGARRQPWCVEAAGGELLGLAGLYEFWREDFKGDGAPQGGWLRTCTIITTQANELMAPIHDRMPVILRPADYSSWLAPGPLADVELRVLLSPVPGDFLSAHRVGTEVGNSRAEGAQLIEPVADPDEPDPASDGAALLARPGVPPTRP